MSGGVSLILDDGVTRLPDLLPGQQIVLGRKHLTNLVHDVAVFVAREQCRIEVREAEKDREAQLVMFVEGLGINPTLLLRKDGSSEHLAKGNLSSLYHGDRIALNCKNPGTLHLPTSQAITVSLESTRRERLVSAPLTTSTRKQGREISWPRNAKRPSTLNRGRPLDSPEGAAAAAITPPAASSNMTSSWPVVLVLVGAPGSGKSTFADSLVAACPGRWSRVCQDTASKSGKRGTRNQCLRATELHLAEGRSVVIDRTNVNPEQRMDFIKAAKKSGCAAHSLFLKYPAKSCEERAMSRTNHEGGVDSRTPGSRKVVHIMAKKIRAPTGSEGFSIIHVCENDSQTASVLSQWTAWTPSQAKGGGAPALLQTGKDMAKEGGQQGTEVGGDVEAQVVCNEGPVGGGTQRRNAFAILMESRGRKANAETSSPSSTSKHLDSQRLITFRGQWMQHLRNVALDPARFAKEQPEMQVFGCQSDASGACVLILDKFPKARRHALVISCNPLLESIEDLRGEHLKELQHMALRGREWAGARQKEDPSLPGFLLGFHSIPSMRQLHMHVVSRDLDSVCLKHKKHWNSFTTAFFRPVEEVIAELQSNGRLNIDLKESDRLLKSELRCCFCQNSFVSMPSLKEHVRLCKLKPSTVLALSDSDSAGA